MGGRESEAVKAMRCVVLMSTYNGARFVGEQIRSILAQLPDEGILLVRDDGSTDATKESIAQFDDPRIELVCGSNLGFARSFFELMRMAPRGRDMYMLADQDDIWLQDKISRAWSQVCHYRQRPFLYCAVPQLVDVALRPIGLGRQSAACVTLLNALVENQVTGCTVAMNESLLDFALPDEQSLSDIHFHDWWLYVVAVAFGTVYCDSTPTILYRQHDGNYMGYGAGLKRYWKMLTYLRRKNWLASMLSQATAFRRMHGGALSRMQLNALNALLTPSGQLRRWEMVCATRRHRQGLGGELLLRALLICDRRRLR